MIERHPLAGQAGPDFYARANCLGSEAHQDLIKQEANGHLNLDTVAAAWVKCMGCLVMTDCLEYGLTIPDRYGMYGTLTRRQRKLISEMEV